MLVTPALIIPSRPTAPPHTCIVAVVLPPFRCLLATSSYSGPVSPGVPRHRRTAGLFVVVIPRATNGRGPRSLTRAGGPCTNFITSRRKPQKNIWMTASRGGSHCSLVVTLSDSLLFLAPSCLFGGVLFLAFLVAVLLHFLLLSLHPFAVLLWPIIQPTSEPHKVALLTLRDLIHQTF